jgi:DNA-binding transcriptional regulator YiaG
MPNLASVLKAEVTRLARKELRHGIEALRQAAASHRTEVAALKRRVADLEKQLKVLSAAAERGVEDRAKAASGSSVDASGLRFRAAGMASNRKRLGLSADEFGLLVGASGQSVYLWEQGKAKPRPQYLAAIAALRGIGRREAAARLTQLKTRA